MTHGIFDDSSMTQWWLIDDSFSLMTHWWFSDDSSMTHNCVGCWNGTNCLVLLIRRSIQSSLADRSSFLAMKPSLLVSRYRCIKARRRSGLRISCSAKSLLRTRASTSSVESASSISPTDRRFPKPWLNRSPAPNRKPLLSTDLWTRGKASFTDSMTTNSAPRKSIRVILLLNGLP